MQENIEIAKDINNKLQQATLVAERVFEGKEISKDFIGLAIKDLKEVEKLLSTLEI